MKLSSIMCCLFVLSAPILIGEGALAAEPDGLRPPPLPQVRTLRIDTSNSNGEKRCVMRGGKVEISKDGTKWCTSPTEHGQADAAEPVGRKAGEAPKEYLTTTKGNKELDGSAEPVGRKTCPTADCGGRAATKGNNDLDVSAQPATASSPSGSPQ